MNSPRIEFVLVRSWPAFDEVRSNNEAVRFRVRERRKFTLLDADWFSTPWELAPAARDAVFAYCEGRATEWGGGKACLVLHARPESADELKRFLTRTLSDPASWLRWYCGHLRFLSLPILEAAA